MILNIDQVINNYIVVWVDSDKFADITNYTRSNSFMKVARQDLDGNYILLRSLDDDYQDHIQDYEFYLEVNIDNASNYENLSKLVKAQEQGYWRFIFLVNDQDNTQMFPGLQVEVNASDDNIISYLDVGVSML